MKGQNNMVEYDLPDGTGKEIADYTEGTLCKKCHEEDLFWHNDTPNNIKNI